MYSEIQPFPPKYYLCNDSYINIQSSFNCNCQKLETIQISFNRCMDKVLWYIYTMEHSSAIKRNELLMNATTWVNLKIIPEEKKPDKKCKEIYSDREQINSCLGMLTGRQMGGNYTRKLLRVMNMEYAHNLDYSRGYMGVYMLKFIKLYT